MPDASPYPGALPSIASWRPLQGPFQRWPHLADLLFALVSFALTLAMWIQSAGQEAINRPAAAAIFLCAFIGNFALLWRRSHPLKVHAVVLAASVLVLLGTMSNGVFALTFSLYSLGRYSADDRSSFIGMLAALLFVSTDLFVLSTPDIGSVIAAGLVILLWYIGRRLRFRGEYLRLLEERAQHLERERTVEAERAVAEERTRIARELHDIVAHQVSLMTVQAGAAKTVARSDPQAALDAMAAVEETGRHALAELRHLLSVLRPAHGTNDLGPQPGIGDLPRLVQDVSGAGPAVRLTTEGPLSELPARLNLTVYRIVQEALTNVLKHAGTAVHAEVVIRAEGDNVQVSIRDDGRGDASGARGGHGIAGMRERAELIGGSLVAGPAPGGGFEVRALLPRGAGAP